jgi:hypothetical protein
MQELAYIRRQFTKLKKDLEEDARRIKGHGSLPELQQAPHQTYFSISLYLNNSLI